MLVEIFLEFLVCIVYVELLKVIHLRREPIGQGSLLLPLLQADGHHRRHGQEECRCLGTRRFRSTSEGTEKDPRVPRSEAHLKVLESKDVKDADGAEVVLALDPAVDLPDDPLEAARVQCHGQGVPAVRCLRGEDVPSPS